MIHEFSSSRTDAGEQAKNARALEQFVASLPGAPSLGEGALVGPFRFEPSPYVPRAVEVFVGKVHESV